VGRVRPQHEADGAGAAQCVAGAAAQPHTRLLRHTAGHVERREPPGAAARGAPAEAEPARRRRREDEPPARPAVGRAAEHDAQPARPQRLARNRDGENGRAGRRGRRAAWHAAGRRRRAVGRDDVQGVGREAVRALAAADAVRRHVAAVDRVDAGAAAEPVGALAAADHVGARAAVHRVRAGRAGEPVGERGADRVLDLQQRLLAGGAGVLRPADAQVHVHGSRRGLIGHGVPAGAAVAQTVAGPRAQHVRAVVAGEIVRAVTTIEHVVAVVAGDQVAAAVALEHIGVVGAGQPLDVRDRVDAVAARVLHAAAPR